jgi:aldehyde:ferredoxin oxidoreductase
MKNKITKQWCGWAGTVLRVDLTRRKIVKQPLTKEMAYNFLGGRGFNAKTLWDEVKVGTDPLGPDNVLCIGVGPLNGTLMPTSSRMNVSCKSALTGIFGDGNAGGTFAAVLKLAGYDQIVFTGKSEEPVYLWIEDDDVELRDAKELWGQTVYEIHKNLMKEHGEDIEICGIGQAGENLVRTASTMSGLSSSATPGSGAVWGSKKVKAVVVRGTKGVKIARFEEFLELCKQDHERLLKIESAQSRYGTIGTAGHARYWSALKGDEFKQLNGLAFLERYIHSLKSCFNCPLHGKRFYRVLVGPYAGTRGSTLEGSPLSAGLAPVAKILDWAAYCKMNNASCQYGIDDEMAWYTIAFAAELYDRGIITKEDTDGIPLDFGNAEAMIEMVHKTALREGFGNKLAEGVYNFAKIIGPEAVKLCGHTLGMSRGWKGYFEEAVLGPTTSTRGADHLRSVALVGGERIPKEIKEARGVVGSQEKLEIWGQHEWVLADSLERCKCGLNSWEVGVPLADAMGVGRAKMLSAATGWDVAPAELDKLAERIYNVERAFNVREGATRKTDCPPPRSFAEGIITKEALDRPLNKYYALRGWDLKTGVPTRAKLEELGLKYVADELEANMPYPGWDGPVLWPLDKYPHGGNRAKY